MGTNCPASLSRAATVNPSSPGSITSSTTASNRSRSASSRSSATRPSVLTAGDLSLDPATRRVVRGGVEVELTAREFSLLEYLLRRQGEVVSKTELLAHVWDAHLDTDLNLVEVYVGYLRRKVDAPFGRSSLQTVRGAGYRLVAEG